MTAQHSRRNPSLFFHASPSVNRESILKYGLDVTRMRAAAGIAGSTEPEAAGTYLVGEVGQALWYASFGQHPRVDIWQVNAFGLQVEVFQDEWLCREVIPLARLTLLESGVTPEQAKRRLPGATDHAGLTGDIEVVFRDPKAEGSNS